MSRNISKAGYATAHWIRFPEIVTPETIARAEAPAESLSWKIGPDGPVGPSGVHLPSNVWCGVALFTDLAAADAALDAKERHLPWLPNAVESWHALLLPIAHRGECNHIERAAPGPIFDIAARDPGGPLLVMTTAGFNQGADLDLARVVDFRVHLGGVHEWLKSVDGRIASQVFTPHTAGDDSVTMSIWRNDAVMVGSMYKPGAHRAQIDRYQTEKTADRASFTRLRMLRTAGQWNGVDLMRAAIAGGG